MSISMYQASVPLFQKFLGNLEHVLDKAAADAATRKFDVAVLLQARLAPDMFPLLKQVQVACDFAKIAPARLAGGEAPKFADDETTLEQLKARIRKTQELLAAWRAEQFAGAAERTINFKAGPRELSMSGCDYLLSYALPNFFFHYTTAYAILRHNGVPLGKSDYMAGRQ